MTHRRNDAPRTRAFDLVPSDHFALMVLAVARDDGREVRVGRVNSWPYSRPREYRNDFDPVVRTECALRLHQRGLAVMRIPHDANYDDRSIAEVTDEGYRWATEEIDHERG